MCVSADSTLLGIAGASEVGVLGTARCNLVRYCRTCHELPPPNASFWRQCEWRCHSGFFLQGRIKPLVIGFRV
jgi:hypothetical protein